MAMTEYSGDTSVIADLGTNPEERGLTTDQFKAKFDEGLTAFVAWFNATHITEVESLCSVTAATRDAQTTGTQNVTLGFRPKHVQIHASISNTKFFSLGDSDGTNTAYTYVFQVNGNYNYGTDAIVMMHSGGSDYTQATITFTSDGFTLTWTKVGTTVTGTINLNIIATKH